MPEKKETDDTPTKYVFAHGCITDGCVMVYVWKPAKTPVITTKRAPSR